MGANTDKGARDVVVLLHGMLDDGGRMRRAEDALRAEGFQTINISYPSTKLDLDGLSDYVHQELSLCEQFNKAALGKGRVHFVAHSLGGLVARHYIEKHRPDNLGRVVMAGTPNNGSAFADLMAANPLMRPVFEQTFGPVAMQLREAFWRAARKEVDYDVGVIAGSRPAHMVAAIMGGMIAPPGQHDGTVSIESTKLKGMRDHLVLPLGHMEMMGAPALHAQMVHFLRRGSFARCAPN